jgi:branched-chain amino acid transport system substrate-binding protein
MADDTVEPVDPVSSRESHQASVTRAFLFADLRGYTDFAERHGDAITAELLGRYRALVRGAIEHFHGAEVRTEGDSFYVVFDSVGEAVRCGLEITRQAAADLVERPDLRIVVGVGINAGETIDTAEGYVGSSVNIAARICAEAGPGEVLVSETVRALTRTLLSVNFESRGRRHLKGVADPVGLFAVTQAAPGAGVSRGSHGRRNRLVRRRVLLPGVLVVLLGVVVVGGAFWPRAAAGLPPGPWHIGLDMPLTGSAAHRGIPVSNAVKLAVDSVNATGGVGGSQIVLDSYDDAGEPPNAMDPARGAANATAMVADPRTVAMVGPWSSPVGFETIPITNQAGLLQCSPANTLPELTKPRFGARDIRSAYPDRINYVRLPPSDDIQGPALASFAFHDLGARTALVVDDTDIGRGIADAFQQAYTGLGGVAVRRALNPGGDAGTVLAPLSSGTGAPTVVFFGGFTDTGAPELRAAMAASGHGSVPFLSWDGIQDGSGADARSYIARAGQAAVGSYMAHASLPPAKAEFIDRYRTAYGTEPDEYTAAGYACVEIITDALRAAAVAGTPAADLREAVRAYAVNTTHRNETVVGSVGFDANGDALQQFVTLYRVEGSAANGAGDWVISKQQDFGPAP